MTRRALVVRPEPGTARTVARLTQAGVGAIAMPLFAVRPLAWTPPDPRDHDALLLTSANAVRHGGAGLAALAHLPVIAVGPATAAAARAAGLRVVHVGSGDAASAVAGSSARCLHLAGRERVILPGVDAVTVYASEPIAVDPGTLAGAARGNVVLFHSARAARRFREVTDPPPGTRLAAISPAVLAAAGAGWARREVAAARTDAALVTGAIRALRD